MYITITSISSNVACYVTMEGLILLAGPLSALSTTSWSNLICFLDKPHDNDIAAGSFHSLLIS